MQPEALQPALRFGLAHLVAWLQGGASATIADARTARSNQGAANAPFAAVTMSSLPTGSPPMAPDGLFIAIRGETRDGHDFAKDAFSNGAIAALAARVPENLALDVQSGAVRALDFRSGKRPSGDRRAQTTGSGSGDALSATELRAPVLLLVDDPMTALQRCAAWWRRQMVARVIGITGSVGKTTTKDLLANVLERRYRVLRTEGNLNNELGLPIMLLKLTPEHERAVLEIGISDVGEMATFAGIAGPDVAVVTRVAPAHMHRFKGLDTVEREKGGLVAALHVDGIAVLNADDPRVARMAQRAPGNVVYYGESEEAAVRASDVAAHAVDGLALTLSYQGKSRRIRVPLMGRHFVTSVLAAAACALVEGCTWDDVAAGLAETLATQRLKPRTLPNGVTLLDDTYNASPEATKAALDVLAPLPGRRVAVLGDMFELGDYARQGHQEVGVHVPGRADALVTVGELGQVIAEAAVASGMPAAEVHSFSSTEGVAAFLAARLGPGDYVLVKGSRGMRMDTIVRALTGEPEAAGEQH